MRGRETACCIWKVKHRISYRSQTIKQKTQLEHVLFENYSELIILLSSQPANLRNWMCKYIPPRYCDAIYKGMTGDKLLHAQRGKRVKRMYVLQLNLNWISLG